MTPKEKLSRTLSDAALLLLILIASTLILTSLLLLVGIKISPITAAFSLFSGLYLFLFLMQNDSRRRVYDAVLAALAVIIISLVISAGIYDLSYDGNWYHKASLGSLAKGWNPIYQSLEQFAADPEGVRIGNLAESAVWADHYCKASWIAGANIYALTGNIECAKAINLIAAFIAFAYAFRLASQKLGILPSVVIALLAALNPITLPQLFTFYTDGLLMSVLFTIILILLIFHTENSPSLPDAAALFCAIVICTNIKFTGLAYAAVFCLAFYLLDIADAVIKKAAAKQVLYPTLFYALAVAVSVLIVGSSSYVKNAVQHKNPLYPLFGSGSVDIMTKNQPQLFDSLSNPEKLFYSTFSRTDNLIREGAVILKAPFDVSDYERHMASSAPDLRLSGFGPLFSGILVISLAVLVLAAIYLFLKNRRALVLSAAVLVPAFLLLALISESWWARYSPHFYLIPLAALYFLFYLASVAGKHARPPVLLLSAVLVLCAAINCTYFAAYIGKCAVKSREISDRLAYARVISQDAPVNIVFSSYAYYGIEYNLKDSRINYAIVAEISGEGLEIYSDKAIMEIPGKEVGVK